MTGMLWFLCRQNISGGVDSSDENHLLSFKSSRSENDTIIKLYGIIFRVKQHPDMALSFILDGGLSGEIENVYDALERLKSYNSNK